MHWKGLIIIILSSAYGILGIIKLIKAKYYWKAIACITYLIGVPVIVGITFNLNLNNHLKIWVGFPMGMLFGFWLLSGFFILQIGERAELKHIKKGSYKRRIYGAIILSISLTTWLASSFYQNMNNIIELLVIATCTIGFMYGLLYLLTGKSIEENDSY